MALRATVATAIAGVLLVPASAHAAYRAFQSPSGKLGCAYYSDAETPRQVRCDWDGSDDRAVVVGETGKGKRIKVSDTVRDTQAKVLAYGHSTTFGKLRCTARATGITCKSTRSGHGFTVSIEKQRVF